MLLHEELLRELRYEPDTGFFFWRRKSTSRKMGVPIGTPDGCGYLQIRFAGKMRKLHKLAWFYVKREWPKDCLDHINCVKSDNRFENLREASRAENAANRNIATGSFVGEVGIYLHRDSKFQARLMHRGKVYTKLCATLNEAREWRIVKEQELFGDFAPLRVVPKVSGEP